MGNDTQSGVFLPCFSYPDRYHLAAVFNHIVQHLLRYKLLQYISENKLKLTEKDVAFIEERNLPPPNRQNLLKSLGDSAPKTFGHSGRGDVSRLNCHSVP